MQNLTCDVAIIGGGIVGIATAWRLSRAYPHLTITVLEKEPALAAHQTGRNSGVIHAGVYYAPGSIKAQFCRAGVKATLDFCRDEGIPATQCGKLIVATSDEDLPRLDALYQRGAENGLALEMLDGAELRRREPHITGKKAIFTPVTGMVDYGDVARAMARKAEAAGVTILTNAEVKTLREDASGVSIETPNVSLRAKHLIACAGLMADRLAAQCGLDLDFRIIPFRGEYFRLRPERDALITHHIYPVPDPALPFLGVHLTKMIGGYLTVGPNAVLAFAREGYRFWDISARDMAQTLAYPGFRKMAAKFLRQGLGEMRNSLSRKRYLALCQRYCPELSIEDLLPYRAGVRAQAIMADGTIVHDFLIRQTARTVHVCNAPSPAATSAMPIADHIIALAAKHFDLPRPGSGPS